MSKQSDAKTRQGYIPKAVPVVCGNCKHFSSLIKPEGNYGYMGESELRCDLGGFAVKKMGTCKEHEFK